VSYEKVPHVLRRAMRAAQRLGSSGALGRLLLDVRAGDLLVSDLRVYPRDGVGLIVFLDLTEFLTLAHQRYFQDWIVSGSLQSGDVLYVTTSLPPWLIIKEEFQSELLPILRDGGATPAQVREKEFWKRNCVPAMMSYFAGQWQHYQLSSLGFKHFFGTT